MAKAKASKAKSPAKKGDLSPRQIARIRELGRAGMGWRPWRLALRYGVSEAAIVELIGNKNAEGRTGSKWIASDKPKASKKPAAKKAAPVKTKAAPKKAAAKKPAAPHQEKAAEAAPAKTGGSALDGIFGKKKSEPEVEIPLNPAQAA